MHGAPHATMEINYVAHQVYYSAWRNKFQLAHPQATGGPTNFGVPKHAGTSVQTPDVSVEEDVTGPGTGARSHVGTTTPAMELPSNYVGSNNMVGGAVRGRGRVPAGQTASRRGGSVTHPAEFTLHGRVSRSSGGIEGDE